MKIGVIGLGRMGEAIVHRLVQAGHEVVAYDVSPQVRAHIARKSVSVVDSLSEIPDHVHVIWLMVPWNVIDGALDVLVPGMRQGGIIIDGGNSKFTDSIERAQRLQRHGIEFVDCGTSGGLHGRENGFSLMIGGSKRVYEYLDPLWRSLAAEQGYGYMGQSGAGHYVKMVHNGIEYGLLQAYAEGFHLLKEGSFKSANLDLEEITRVWQHGSIIRSWILQLSHDIFAKDQLLEHIEGAIGQLGTGKWTVEDARQNNVPVECIEKAVQVRVESEKTGGNFATKIVAMLRNAFGGHAVKQKE